MSSTSPTQAQRLKSPIVLNKLEHKVIKDPKVVRASNETKINNKGEPSWFAFVILIVTIFLISFSLPMGGVRGKVLRRSI